ncbi:MAG: radical SAM protein [bacterium]
MRFIGRIEHFGSLIYDTIRREYIPLDQDGTNIILNLKPNTDPQILYYKYFSSKFSYPNFKSFLQLIQSVEIIDQNYNSNVRFIDNPDLEYYIQKEFISAPLKINFALTYECHLKCKHCFSNSGKKTQEELNQELKTEKILEIIDELEKMGIYYISFGGGEPFLKKDFIQILKKADQKKMNISISTSLSFPDLEKFIEMFHQEDITISELKISIEAVTAKEYSNVRGKNVFETLKKNLLILNDYKKTKNIFTRFSFILNKQNYTYLPNFLSFSEQYNADGIIFYPIYNIGRAQNHPELMLSNQDLEKIGKIIQNMKQRTKLEIDFFSIPFKFGRNRLYSSFGCSCGKTTIYISPTGQVLPSGFFIKYQNQFSLGNIHNKTLRQIWKENTTNQLNNLPTDTKCNGCYYLDECKGGCLLRSFDKYQKIGYKDPTCTLQ